MNNMKHIYVHSNSVPFWFFDARNLTCSMIFMFSDVVESVSSSGVGRIGGGGGQARTYFSQNCAHNHASETAVVDTCTSRPPLKRRENWNSILIVFIPIHLKPIRCACVSVYRVCCGQSSVQRYGMWTQFYFSVVFANGWNEMSMRGSRSEIVIRLSHTLRSLRHDNTISRIDLVVPFFFLFVQSGHMSAAIFFFFVCINIYASDKHPMRAQFVGDHKHSKWERWKIGLCALLMWREWIENVFSFYKSKRERARGIHSSIVFSVFRFYQFVSSAIRINVFAIFVLCGKIVSNSMRNEFHLCEKREKKNEQIPHKHDQIAV